MCKRGERERELLVEAYTRKKDKGAKEKQREEVLLEHDLLRH